MRRRSHAGLRQQPGRPRQRPLRPRPVRPAAPLSPVRSRLRSRPGRRPGLPRQERNGQDRAGPRKGQPGQEPTGLTALRTSGPPPAGAQLLAATHRGTRQGAGVPRTGPRPDTRGRVRPEHDQTDGGRGAWEPETGTARSLGAIQSEAGRRPGRCDPAKDQHPHPVPRMPGKAVIHLSGNDRNLGSAPAADQGWVREGTG